MAGSVSKISSSGMYRARIRDDTGRQHARHFRTVREARDWLDEQTRVLRTGGTVTPARVSASSAPTFRDYAQDTWMPLRAYRHDTEALVDRILRRRVYPTLGALPLDMIAEQHIIKMVRSLSRSYSPDSIRLALVYARSVLAAAVDDGIIRKSPASRVQAPEAEDVEAARIPSGAEVARVLSALLPHHLPLAQTILATGMRRSEAIGLTIDRVDMTRGTILIDRQLRRGGMQPVWGPPKTKASKRTIPIPESICALIEEQPPGPGGVVFTGRIGGAVGRSTASGAIQDAADRAGVDDFTIHSLRHYYASLLIAHGESPKTVQALLGHASITETLDTYTHLWPQHDETARAVVSDHLADVMRQVAS